MDLEFGDFREIALEKPETLLVLSELMERGRRDDRIAEAIQPMKQRWRQILAGLLSEGVSDGVYRPAIDTEAFASIMMATFIGFCRNPEKNPERLARLVGELKRAIRNPALDHAADLSKVGRAVRQSGK